MASSHHTHSKVSLIAPADKDPWATSLTNPNLIWPSEGRAANDTRQREGLGLFFYGDKRSKGGGTLTRCKCGLPALKGLGSHPTEHNLQEIWQEPCHAAPERIAKKEMSCDCFTSRMGCSPCPCNKSWISGSKPGLSLTSITCHGNLGRGSRTRKDRISMLIFICIFIFCVQSCGEIQIERGVVSG